MESNPLRLAADRSSNCRRCHTADALGSNPLSLAADQSSNCARVWDQTLLHRPCSCQLVGETAFRPQTWPQKQGLAPFRSPRSLGFANCHTSFSPFALPLEGPTTNRWIACLPDRQPPPGPVRKPADGLSRRGHNSTPSGRAGPLLRHAIINDQHECAGVSADGNSQVGALLGVLGPHSAPGCSAKACHNRRGGVGCSCT
jgi:hypothetical protein